MGGEIPENYLEEPPQELEISLEKWKDLSYHQQYYRANEEQRQSIRESAKRNRQRNKKWFEEIKSDSECEKCGEDRNAALDFHHTEDKKDTLSKMVMNMYSIEKLEEELEKCVPLCANCHRVLHQG